MDIVDCAFAPLAGHDAPAEPERAGRGTAVHRPRHRARLRRAAGDRELLGGASGKYYAAVRDGPDRESAEVYLHEMPGGQYANLYQQAQSLGVGDRWHEVGRMYAAVNQLFGDIVKVTPTSKVVGDMALFMLANNLTPEEVLDPKRELAFPESVVEFFEGKLGQPPGGFPPALQARVLRGRKPLTDRPGRTLPPADFAKARDGTGGEARPHADRPGRDLVPALPEGVRRVRRAPGEVLRPQRAADAGVLLRHGDGRGGERRHRAGQDADRQVPDGRRAAGGRPAGGVLRAERPAARGARRSTGRSARRR